MKNNRRTIKRRILCLDGKRNIYTILSTTKTGVQFLSFIFWLFFYYFRFLNVGTNKYNYIKRLDKNVYLYIRVSVRRCTISVRFVWYFHQYFQKILLNVMKRFLVEFFGNKQFDIIKLLNDKSMSYTIKSISFYFLCLNFNWKCNLLYHTIAYFIL